MIGKLLGHTQVQTTARYAHLAADPVKSTADQVSASIAAALNHAARIRLGTGIVEGGRALRSNP